MAHIIRPISTVVSSANWLPIGGPATLWECVNDVVADDTTYAWVKEPTGAPSEIWRFRLGPGTDHGIHTGHIVRWRMRRHAIAIRLNIRFFQDGVLIADLGTRAFLGPPNDFYDHSITLTGVQAALITDYTLLELQMASNNFNVGNHGDISWVELELPGASWLPPTVKTERATEIKL